MVAGGTDKFRVEAVHLREVATRERRPPRLTESVGAVLYGRAMKLLHTSDWHVGRTFHGVDLLADQAHALESIARIVADRAVDVVVVPGDVYDRAIPSADAITVCNNGFEAIRAAGARIVATPGNHDSPARLGAAASFASAGGLHLMTRVADVATPVLLDDEYGQVAFYGIPYLEPETSRSELGVDAARSHADVLAAAMKRVRQDRARRGIRSVVLAHAFVVGCAAAGSERSISVGGVETVPSAVFDGIDYVALGHLHSPQTVAPNVRYSGSPLPYSFAERSHRKAVWLADIGRDGLVGVERVDLPVVRGLSQLTGTLAELLTEPGHAGAEQNYVAAILTDPARPLDAIGRLRTRFPHVVHAEWMQPQVDSIASYRDRVCGRSDADIVRRFLADVAGEVSPSQLEWVERALARPEADVAVAPGEVRPA